MHTTGTQIWMRKNPLKIRMKWAKAEIDSIPVHGTVCISYAVREKNEQNERFFDCYFSTGSALAGTSEQQKQTTRCLPFVPTVWSTPNDDNLNTNFYLVNIEYLPIYLFIGLRPNRICLTYLKIGSHGCEFHPRRSRLLCLTFILDQRRRIAICFLVFVWQSQDEFKNNRLLENKFNVFAVVLLF